MSKINEILDHSEIHINSFKETLNTILSEDSKVIKDAINYIISSQGKQVRPLLTILVAKLHGEPNHKTHLSSSLIELTHCASLIHDDIIDEAYMRRDILSMYAIWRNRNSVLIGDYIFSKAIKVACNNELFKLLGRISSVIEHMSLGELDQSDTAKKLNITEEKYYSIIKSKTAELISSCCYAGALSTDATDNECSLMSEFGYILGMIFQIKDDILDYSVSSATGKKEHNDIRERKITLPLIVALRESDEKTRSNIFKHIKKANKSDDSVKIVLDFVMQSNGMKYCYDKIEEYRLKAEELLSYYQDSKEKNDIIELMKYFIERTK